MTKGKNDMEIRHYFITLKLREKCTAFLDPIFRTQVELHWAAVMQQDDALENVEYVVNDVAIHALLALPPTHPDAHGILLHAMRKFMALACASWSGKGELWANNYKIRPIKDADELHSLHDFIVQKMLGGKELSDLGEED